MSVAFANMDVKLSAYIICFVCVTFGLQNASAETTIPEMTLSTENRDRNKKCTRKYTTCTLDLGGKIIKERGEKGDVGNPGIDGAPGKNGEKGEPGIQGLQGEPGVKGERGESGFNGIAGLQGLKGERGENGKEGPRGPSGSPGQKGKDGVDGLQGPSGVPGENGKDGLPGPPGLKGDRGEDGKIGPAGPEGKPGPVGPPGIPGSPGICPCSMPTTTMDITEESDDFGTEDTPAVVPCKAAPAGVRNGKYFMGPIGKPMEVFCNMTSFETCIRLSNSTPVCYHKPEKGGFWLNEMKVHMKELYNSITVDQLTWLRDRSETVRQTLKYHCFDSVPYNRYKMSASVKLWAWNDVMIGPYPTSESPIFYSVPESTDECKPGSTEWKSTIIELRSSNVYRLPIVDLWIGDIRNVEHQKMKIESVELCFG